MNCEKCHKEMRKIGPFARIKSEGEPSYKWDGMLQYQCLNDYCEDYQIIVTVKE